MFDTGLRESSARQFSLTERGEELMPILQSIVDWGLTGAHEEILGIA